MQIGLGLYRHLLTPDNYTFARQMGVEQIVVHLENYLGSSDEGGVALSRGDDDGWGEADNGDWSYERLRGLVDELGIHGLKIAAIENFAVRQWHDVLLAGPRRDEQLAQLQQIIRNVGRAGIPCIGYNFSLAGVWGWDRGPFARGGALSVGFNADNIDIDQPIPDGMVWNMRYRPGEAGKTLAPVSSEQLWERFAYFLKAVLPVAEEAGVMLAAHPDDPPMPALRGMARLVNEQHKYDRLIALDPRPANGLELCLGSLQEMPGSDVYAAVDKYSRENRIGYIHFRNVVGKVPNYREVFVDEGDLDMAKVMAILKHNNFKGLLIPDHTPELHCNAPWHAGMAYAIGYMRALLATA
ncbi:mannonate dehydratase [Devosia sp. YIM 151766]|uniref:mannonate dehydratase n=1 Tax=Devosia sp. YIM 151766 TaxID=3017325 RepID=UPI00255CEE44|nr:mannonate dehydratase [Devosia sp. YIM 151766]WIY54467.1 mannonate dehydratase [Devosia sp. YIM 151766]